jgi:hypothetical protein
VTSPGGAEAEQVPSFIGTLELLIRSIKEGELPAALPKTGDVENQRYELAQTQHRAATDDDDDAFDDWREAKPRQTHIAEYRVFRVPRMCV